jgi:protein-tyrosine phosphatase
MIELYRRLARLESAHSGYRAIFQRLAQEEAYPFLVHCSAGKDRTGVVCALIHAVCGVSQEHILEDFMLTRQHYEGAQNIDARVPQIMAGLDVEGWTIEALRPVFTVEEAYLEGFLDAVAADHGSIEAFLTGPVGLAPATLEAVRERLLEPA